MNKLSPGDLIELKTRKVREQVKNLGLLYLKQESGEFVTDFASEVAMFLGSYLKKSDNPAGKILSYGARIDGTGQRYLQVRVKNKSGSADVLAVLEQDVILLKRKK